MYFQQINPGTDPEKIFITVKNTYGTSAITTGQAVVWDLTTDLDGVGVTRCTAALASVPAGIVASSSIAAGGYGLVQVYGINPNAYIDGSSGCIGGIHLRIVTQTFNLLRISTAATAGASYTFISAAVDSTGAAVANQKVFIRGM
jgi:hypothetical protein